MIRQGYKGQGTVQRGLLFCQARVEKVPDPFFPAFLPGSRRKGA